ncbi:Mfs multidrug [Pleurostoma richardsiae]|uniref:Mfs multidrug n=1 Tax=Pleurostoma richardsiae TaxID=41990 RepID=A0AA38RCW5_9PEZI|nr:Mfs multidrug [Pleurostoma richardsiae]
MEKHSEQKVAPAADLESVGSTLVTWDGLDDTEDPKNWPFSIRWRITGIVSAFTFISPVSTSMTAPSLGIVGTDLGITKPFTLSLTLSIFVLAYSVSPFLVGPLCELYGRRPVLQLFNLFYLAFNTACGFAQTGTQLIVFRFFAGFGGCAAQVIGNGVLADIWRKEERGLSIGLYTLITLLSPTLGPVLGGFITQYSSWRWTFWAVSIADSVIQVAGVIGLRETFAPVLLGRKAERLRRETGNIALHTKWEGPDRNLAKLVGTALSRPFILMATEPILQLLILYVSYLFGLVYLALTTFAELWTSRYHESISIAGLNYLALAVGYIIGTQTCARSMDIIYKRLKESRGKGRGRPEYRLPLLLPGSLLVPVGLLWYGWSAEKHLHWIMPDIGIAIMGVGIKFGMQTSNAYALDVYPTYAASASAGSLCVRSLAGFSFPLFAPYMYSSLGYGWANSVLALVALCIGLPAPFLLWLYGPVLRKQSRYVKAGL